MNDQNDPLSLDNLMRAVSTVDAQQKQQQAMLRQLAMISAQMQMAQAQRDPFSGMNNTQPTLVGTTGAGAKNPSQTIQPQKLAAPSAPASPPPPNPVLPDSLPTNGSVFEAGTPNNPRGRNYTYGGMYA